MPYYNSFVAPFSPNFVKDAVYDTNYHFELGNLAITVVLVITCVITMEKLK